MTQAPVKDGIAGWKYWDAIALLAGAVPLIILALFYSEATPATLNALLLILSLVTYPIATLLSWRQGDCRLAAAGGMLLILAVAIASPLILLLTACLMGDCI